jgi:hypothetical protein
VYCKEPTPETTPVTTIESFESTPEEDLDATMEDIEPEAQEPDSNEEVEEEAQAEANTQLDETEPGVQLDKEGSGEGLDNDGDTQQDEEVIEVTVDEIATTLPGSEEIPGATGTSILSFSLRPPFTFSSFTSLRALYCQSIRKRYSTVSKMLSGGYGGILYSPCDPLGSMPRFLLGLLPSYIPIRPPTCIQPANDSAILSSSGLNLFEASPSHACNVFCRESRNALSANHPVLMLCSLRISHHTSHILLSLASLRIFPFVFFPFVRVTVVTCLECPTSVPMSGVPSVVLTQCRRTTYL